jgi:hypothetical protein
MAIGGGRYSGRWHRCWLLIWPPLLPHTLFDALELPEPLYFALICRDWLFFNDLDLILTIFDLFFGL